MEWRVRSVFSSLNLEAGGISVSRALVGLQNERDQGLARQNGAKNCVRRHLSESYLRFIKAPACCVIAE